MSNCKEVNEGRQSGSAVEVKQTSLGSGVFAQRAIKKGTIVGEIDGEIMGSDFESDYCMHLDAKAVLEPMRPFRFLNHSCMPNCELVLWKHRKVDGRKVPRLWVSALKSIKKGHELTIDYAWPADAAIPCECRTTECRQWIVDPAELSQLRGKRRLNESRQ